jgi:BlaI family transcriptional regulator, penicillinase repressor
MQLRRVPYFSVAKYDKHRIMSVGSRGIRQVFKRKGSGMAKRSSSHPTGAELEILSVLWRRGSSTVRDVHEELQANRQTTLTTTLKILQVMTEKALVLCNNDRPHVYAAAVPQEQTQAGLLKDLTRRAFDGSVQKLLIRAVEDSRLSNEELQEIHNLIDTIRKSKRGDK